MNDLSVTLAGVARDDGSFRAESGGEGSQLWGQLEKCLRQREQQRWTSRGGTVLAWREQSEDDGGKTRWWSAGAALTCSVEPALCRVCRTWPAHC